MIESAGLSDSGRKRQSNQDAYLINVESQLYLLADGMGGALGGAEAAKLTVNTISEFVQSAQTSSAEVSWPFGYSLQIPFEANVLRTALLLANLKVCRAAEEQEHFTGMGSTVVAVWVRDSAMFWTHLGDSRLYLLRNGSVRQLSEDHTLVREQLRQGIITPEEARHHALRHVVTRAIGSRERFEVEVREEQLEHRDTVLLCSDGLTNLLEEEDLAHLLLNDKDLEESCRQLVDLANERGGDDNVTVVIFRLALTS